MGSSLPGSSELEQDRTETSISSTEKPLLESDTTSTDDNDDDTTSQETESRPGTADATPPVNATQLEKKVSPEPEEPEKELQSEETEDEDLYSLPTKPTTNGKEKGKVPAKVSGQNSAFEKLPSEIIEQ
jgi:hypothetical protein